MGNFSRQDWLIIFISVVISLILIFIAYSLFATSKLFPDVLYMFISTGFLVIMLNAFIRVNVKLAEINKETLAIRKDFEEHKSLNKEEIQLILSEFKKVIKEEREINNKFLNNISNRVQFLYEKAIE